MTKITIQTPVEIDMDGVPDATLLNVLKKRICDDVRMTKDQFLDLVDCIIEMRTDDTFALLEAISPHLVNATHAKSRFLHTLMNRRPSTQTQEAAQ